MAPRFKCCRKEYWKEKANLTWTSNVTKRKKLFDVDYIDDNGEIEPYPIDDVIDTVFEWEKDRKTLIYGQVDYMYGEALYKPEMKEGNPIRLYSLDEITEIFGKLGLRICNSFADFNGKPSSDNDIQLMVYSIRE